MSKRMNKNLQKSESGSATCSRMQLSYCNILSALMYII